MKREHISNLGYFIQRRREGHSLRRRRLAHLVGFDDSKVGASVIRRLETVGEIDPPDLLERIAAVLDLDEETIHQLQEKDRQAAGEWVRKVCQGDRSAYIGFRWNSFDVPKQVCSRGLKAIEHYARGCAAFHRMPFRVILSHRIQFVLDESGNLVEIRELGRDGWLNDELQN